MSTPSLILRQVATEATVAEFNTQPLEWGKHDCVKMGMAHLKNMGHHPPSDLGTWTTEAQALRAFSRAMKRLGVDEKDGLPGLVDALGFFRMPVAYALPGDLVAYEAGEPWYGALGIAVGNGQAMAIAHDSILIGELKAATTAWRVEPEGD